MKNKQLATWFNAEMALITQHLWSKGENEKSLLFPQTLEQARPKDTALPFIALDNAHFVNEMLTSEHCIPHFSDLAK